MKLLSSLLFRCIDYFATPVYGEDPAVLARARALVGTNLFIGLVLFIGMIFVASLQTVGEKSSFFVWALLLPAFIVVISIPITLRHKAWLASCQQLTLLVTFSAVVIGISTSGGPVLAPNNQLMVLQAALAFFLLGIRGGMVWSFIVLTTQGFLYYLFISGVDFPNLQTHETATVGAIFNWSLAFFAITSLIVLIELSREKLEEQRNFERDRLQHLATHDPLTQIPNRALFEEALERAVSGHRVSDTRAILFYIDLDDFKPVNDRWGHDTGDKVLQVIAARLKANTREKDIVARLGGDEFAVLMNDIEKNTPVDSLAEAIHNRIAEEIHISEQHFHLSCSIGICIFPEQADNADQFWQRADNAMYEAKKKSQRWHLYA